MSCIFLDVFSTYDDVEPIINFTERDVRTASITCYSHHVCHNHRVNIVWYLNIRSSLHEPVEYFTEDSELLHSEYGISIQSNCPAEECYSTLRMPNEEGLNNTVIWCGGYTEVCPETKTTSHPVTVITKCKDPCTAGIF